MMTKMKSFKEFYNESVELLEKYYDPYEKLPSGKTPVEKAKTQNRRVGKAIATKSSTAQKRWGKHYDKIETKVKHGADNPDYNDNVSIKDKGKIHVKVTDGELGIHHKKSGVWFNAHPSEHSPHAHTIEWGHNKNKAQMSARERLRLAKTAKKVWDKHVSHRLPHGAVVHNTPMPSLDKKGNDKPINRRARLYQRAGFGRMDSEGDQFAKVNREPSPRQKKRGKGRLSPMSPSRAKEYVEWNKNDDDYSENY